MEKRRDPYWDNVKFALIFLVVLGHFLLPVQKGEHLIKTLYRWIYLFHMPAFIFVSGYFSKSYVRKKGKVSKLTGYLLLYLTFTVCLWIVKWIVTHRFNGTVLLRPSSAQWYMLAMFFWLLLIPLFARIPCRIALCISLAAALLAGMIPSLGNFLALARVIVFFPFFLLGYYFDGEAEKFLREAGWRVKAVSAGLLAVFFVVFYVWGGKLRRYFPIVYGRVAYKAMGLSAAQGCLLRLAWFFLALLAGAAFFCLVPNRRLRITPIGERTLGIYFVHRLIRDVFKNLHLYKYMGTGWVLLLSCVAVSVLVTYVSSAKIITESLNRLFLLGSGPRNREQ